MKQITLNILSFVGLCLLLQVDEIFPKFLYIAKQTPIGLIYFLSLNASSSVLHYKCFHLVNSSASVAPMTSPIVSSQNGYCVLK